MWKFGPIKLYAQANAAELITYPLTLNLYGQPSELTGRVQCSSLSKTELVFKKEMVFQMVIEDSSKVEIREESFQLQRVMNIYVEIRKSEKKLRNSKWSSLIRTIEDP